MKNVIRIFFILSFLLFPFSVFAEVCAFVSTLDFIQGGGACSQVAPTISPPPPDAVNCPSTGTLMEWGNCTALWQFCCTPAINQFEAIVRNANTISGVPFGQESVVAQQYFDNFVSTVPEAACDVGYTSSGFLAGYAYETSIDPVVNDSLVLASAWKRTLCAKDGTSNIIPLSGLSGSGSGSGGSGGLTEAQTAAAVTTGVSGVQTGITTLDTQLQMINGVLINYSTLYGSRSDTTNQTLSSISGKADTSNTQLQMINGLLTNLNSLYGTGSTETNRLLTSIDSKVGTGSGGGLTQAETAAAVQDGLNNAAGVTPASLGMSSYTKPGAYSNPEFSSFGSFDFGSRVNTFVADVKTAPLFSSFTLGGLADTPAGVSSMPVNFGSFGSVNFDLATYAGTYDYIKGFLLLLGSYLAVRIVVLKR